MRNIIIALLVGAAVGWSTGLASADDEAPPLVTQGRGFLGYANNQQGWGYFKVFEPEPGVRCYQLQQAGSPAGGAGLSCIKVGP